MRNSFSFNLPKKSTSDLQHRQAPDRVGDLLEAHLREHTRRRGRDRGCQLRVAGARTRERRGGPGEVRGLLRLVP